MESTDMNASDLPDRWAPDVSGWTLEQRIAIAIFYAVAPGPFRDESETEAWAEEVGRTLVGWGDVSTVDDGKTLLLSVMRQYSRSSMSVLSQCVWFLRNDLTGEDRRRLLGQLATLDVEQDGQASHGLVHQRAAEFLLSVWEHDGDVRSWWEERLPVLRELDSLDDTEVDYGSELELSCIEVVSKNTRVAVALDLGRWFNDGWFRGIGPVVWCYLENRDIPDEVITSRFPGLCIRRDRTSSDLDVMYVELDPLERDPRAFLTSARVLPDATEWVENATDWNPSAKEERTAASVSDADLALEIEMRDELAERAASLQEQGRYDDAIDVATQALQVIEQAIGPTHPDVVESLLLLAGLFGSRDEYAQAEPLLERALAIREEAFGPDHPDVAESLNSLAVLYGDADQYAKAEPLLLRALAIQEKVLGPEHPDLLHVLENVSYLYVTQEQYAQAEPFYKRALAIQEQTVGPDHPDVAEILRELAVLYRTQGQYAQAEPLLLRAMAIQEEAVGPDHLDVALCLSSLALLYNSQGQYELAEPLFERSLAIREKVLGPGHPDVGRAMTNLVELYRAQGQHAKAEALLKRFQGPCGGQS